MVGSRWSIVMAKIGFKMAGVSKNCTISKILDKMEFLNWYSAEETKLKTVVKLEMVEINLEVLFLLFNWAAEEVCWIKSEKKALVN
ncbi:hypothetical protein WICPIJ_005052 [Wickerhamomyces pijperi]|uniref:Uncharacterized protein n=1 Tax=Wickerhamomyces pijperi TaxID=599730 RepID=A0A9P8Q4T0_WICPI|nr:hypothetical protein WICPIJ_005052 [Wickerhamomyces pijperi]